MRIAVYQTPSPAGDLPAGFDILDLALTNAALADADMLVMPELFLPGYNAVTATPPEGWDRVMTQVQDMCKRHDCALTIGLPDYDTKAVYNAAYAISATGEAVAKYRKLQLWGARENALFSPGDGLVTFSYGGTKFGLAICYDIEFPEHARALARAGVAAILTPTANMMPHINVNLIQVPGRAMENGISIAYANYTGSEGDLDYVGHSVISGPDGYPMAAKGMGAGLLVADLPTGLGENGIPYSTQLSDYRPAKPPMN